MLFLLAAVMMIGYGAWRGEAALSLRKQFDYVWSVLALDKNRSHFLARFRGLIQAGAALLTNIHLPNFLKGTLYQARGNISAFRA